MAELRDQFVPDLLSVFYNSDEHAAPRKFRIADGKGGFIRFTAVCIWDEEQSKERPIVREFEVFLGSVVCHIGAWNFPRRPIAGEIIYCPPEQGWVIVDCTYEEGAYLLALQAHGAH